MREGLQQFKLSLLDYCFTCNHVHLIADTEDKDDISRFMKKVAGEFAQAYNRRKCRTDAVWGDCYHATLIDTGQYLENCIRYVELNMVRCGRVVHPREWEWLGYHEIMGSRRRYRLLDLERLCWRFGGVAIEQLRTHLEERLNDAIAKGQLAREPWWTESLAVGRPEFLDHVRPMLTARRDLEISQPLPDAAPGVWALKEAGIPYTTGRDAIVSETSVDIRPDA
jgi:putative transposase